MTRDEFLKQMNETEGVRAGRLWATFQEQLRDGHVDFLENGSVGFSMPLALALTLTLTVTPNPNPIPNPNPNPHQVRFSMPLTHRIAPFVHPALVEAIETVAGAAQRGYRKLPRQWRQQVEALLDWAVESGALHAAVVVLLTVILLDVLLERRSQRRDDQLDERAEQVLRQLKAGRAGGGGGAMARGAGI